MLMVGGGSVRSRAEYSEQSPSIKLFTDSTRSLWLSSRTCLVLRTYLVPVTQVVIRKWLIAYSRLMLLVSASNFDFIQLGLHHAVCLLQPSSVQSFACRRKLTFRQRNTPFTRWSKHQANMKQLEHNTVVWRLFDVCFIV